MIEPGSRRARGSAGGVNTAIGVMTQLERCVDTGDRRCRYTRPAEQLDISTAQRYYLIEQPPITGSQGCDKSVFHEPHPQKETKKGAIQSLRDFLVAADVRRRE